MSKLSDKKSRLVHKEQSDLHIATLDDERTRHSLATLQKVLRTCYGPHGMIHMVHNNVGGHVTVTGCSGRLLQVMSVNNALVRVVTTSMEAHLSRFSDGGLFSGLLCLLLVENSLKLENDIECHRHLLTDIFEVLLNESLLCLKAANFKAGFELDFSSVTMPLCYIKTAFQTKRISCGLSIKDIDHFAPLILKTFLEVYSPTGNLGTIHYLALEGLRPTESALYNGVLFEMPTTPVLREDPINVKRIADGPITGQIRVALIGTSMSGDTEELPEATYEISDPKGITEVVVDELTRFAEKLIELDTGLVACQKVVHPRVKELLRESGVFVIDRLGRKYIDALQEFSSAQLIHSFTSDPDPALFGALDGVECVVLQKKNFIHLNRSSANVVTLVLCSYSEEATQELKYVVKGCISNLEVAMSNNNILCGGGCWITVLTHQLRARVDQQAESLCADLCSTKHQLTAALDVFTRSLERVALQLGHPGGDHLVDSAHRHFWSAPPGCVSAQNWSHMENESCQCGAITNEDGKLEYDFIGDKVTNVISNDKDSGLESDSAEFDMKSVKLWDSLPLYTNALQTSVLTANMLLGVHSYIQNTN